MDSSYKNSPAGRVPLSIIIPVLNEELLLPRVLASVKRLGVEVFILDSGSTDRSVEIAQSFGCHIAQGQWGSFSEKLNWGLTNLPFKTSWVMRLDADEYFTETFIAQIGYILQTMNDDVDGLIINRRVIFLGKWLKYGGMHPLEHLRISRVGRATYENRLLDEHVFVPGKTLKIPLDICDEESRGLANWSHKHIGYAETECYILHNSLTSTKTWKSLSGSARWRRFIREELYSRSPLFMRPMGFFVYRYILQLGFLDGRPGFIYHILNAFWYRILIDALIFEAKITNGSSVKKSHII